MINVGGQKIKMSKKTLAVDSDMIDQALDELAKLILRLDKNPKRTRKEQNTIKKIQEIWDTIQDSVLYALFQFRSVAIRYEGTIRPNNCL